MFIKVYLICIYVQWSSVPTTAPLATTAPMTSNAPMATYPSTFQRRLLSACTTVTNSEVYLLHFQYVTTCVFGGHLHEKDRESGSLPLISTPWLF